MGATTEVDLYTVKKTADSVLKACKIISIDSQEKFDWAKQNITKIKVGMKMIDEHYAPLKANAHKAHKTITSQYNRDIKPFKEIKKILDSKMTNYIVLCKENDKEVKTGKDITVKTKWGWDLLKEEELGREYLVPNFEKIDKIVQAQGKLAEQSVPGISVYEIIKMSERL